MMSRVLRVLRHPAVRWAFLMGALGLATWAVASDGERIGDAVSSMPWWATVVALLLSFGYVFASLESWRSVMNDMGAGFAWRTGAHVFLLSQIGKYIPGGVWNVVAGAELARDKGVSRAKAAAGLAVTMFTSILIGVALAGIGLGLGPHTFPTWTRFGLIATPIAIALLAPPLLTRVVAFALKLARRQTTLTAFTARGVAGAATWALLAWSLAGIQVWVLGIGLGMETSWQTAFTSVCGFAGAWVVGFAALFMPAGIGARELVLYPVMEPYLGHASLVALVVLSRVLFTVADVVLAALPLAWRTRR